VTEELRELILVGASSLELRRKAVEEGMLTLRMSGLEKVKEGVTTIDEVVRETVK
jgi:type IV pilus assembly protein PilB